MIKFDKVSKSHDGKAILKNFDLELKSSEKKLIYGSSGSGKTTVLRLILGFERPDSGSIYYDDKQLKPDLVKKIRREVALVPQNLDISEGDVYEFIENVFTLDSTPELSEDKLNRFAKILHIHEDDLHKDFEQLSGGEKQRISILIALLLERKIFLLDEPTSSLDKDLKRIVKSLFMDMDDASMIIVSHDSIWKDDDIEIIDLENM
ncbi:MAG: ATP-binding cassette domain-containing protein [Candidatus Zixiibacteriota bacterium]